MGEGIARRHLERKGLKILEQNFANKFGELDLIAQDGDTVVFVEVKTKIGELFGTPEEMVGAGKLARVRRMGLVYLGEGQAPCRIDVIAIVLTPEGDVIRLNHYENVY